MVEQGGLTCVLLHVVKLGNDVALLQIVPPVSTLTTSTTSEVLIVKLCLILKLLEFPSTPEEVSEPILAQSSQHE